MSLHRRDRMLDAVESAESPLKKLRAVVQILLDTGTPVDVLVDDLDQIRGLVDEAQEDIMLEVMDFLVGWCAPSARMVPRTD